MTGPVPPLGVHHQAERQRRTILGVAAVIVLVARGRGRSPATTIDGRTKPTGRDRPPCGGSRRRGRHHDDHEAPLPPFDGWVNPASSGRPWSDKVDGLLTFRGNPTRTLLRQGPGAHEPRGAVAYPGESGGMCGESSDGGETTTWCGTGWTGQPSVWENGRPDLGRVRRLRQGRALLDAETGERHPRRLPDRRHHQGLGHHRPRRVPARLHGVARQLLPRDRRSTAAQPTELWKLSADAVSPTMWNNDWDGSGARHRRLPLRGRREQPVPHREAQPGATAPTARSRSTPSSSSTRRAGTTSCWPTSATRRCRSRTRSPSPATPCTSPTPAGSSRAGTSAALADGATPHAHVPLLDRRRHRRLGRHRRRGDAVRRRPSTSGATSTPAPRSARS